MKIDAYSHILPRASFDRLVEVAPDQGAIKRRLTIPVLHDLEARLAMMEEFGPDYQQILTLSMPALESVAGPDETPALARLANDSMAELVARRPARFPGFVASLIPRVSASQIW
jgi:predicted TIM-barrel fold metal-dependent hydrolase